MEIEVLRALALAADDPAAATAALLRSVALAAPQRDVRTFVDEGVAMAALLRDAIAAPTSADEDPVVLDHLAELVRAIDPPRPDAETGEPAPQPLVVPLTDRELEVLHQLATGSTNREIADELFVSLNTVKKHITHILEKLGSANRTAAVDRARTLGLLR